MKRMKVLLMVAVLIMIALCGTNSYTGTALYTCTVVMTGPTGVDTVQIRLTDTAANPVFTNKWFAAKKGQENRMLAVAIAAMTNGKKVFVEVDGHAPAPAEIQSIYLKP